MSLCISEGSPQASLLAYMISPKSHVLAHAHGLKVKIDKSLVKKLLNL